MRKNRNLSIVNVFFILSLLFSIFNLSGCAQFLNDYFGFRNPETAEQEKQREEGLKSIELIDVITKSTIIIGDQQEGCFVSGRTVILPPYSIGKYEVTQDLYESIMKSNPSYGRTDPAPGEIQKRRPVEGVTLYQAIAFCNKMSVLHGFKPVYSVSGITDWMKLNADNIPSSYNSAWANMGVSLGNNGYRLPTEAEWEFAARGGNQGAADWNYTYSGSDTISKVAWYSSNSNNKTHEVGKKLPNRLGLYDMSGNVWEWCIDTYTSEFEPTVSVSPIIFENFNSQTRVQRGGCWKDPASWANLCYRRDDGCGGGSTSRWDDWGFRLVRSADNWQEEYDKAMAEYYKPNPTFPENPPTLDELVEKCNNNFVQVISQGTTIIGDQSDGVFPAGRTVILSPYSINKYEVTQDLYQAVMEVNPSHYSSNPTYGEIQRLRPVDNINWYRAIAFCNKLSLIMGLEPCYSVKDSSGNEIDWANLLHSSIPVSDDIEWESAVCDMSKIGYRLPTEAEWEFAARGGDQSAADWNYAYSGSDTISSVAWYSSNSNNKTHEVGKKLPNRLGLYDMSGNVWDWTNDSDFSVNTSETVIDPIQNFANDYFRIRRGGCISPACSNSMCTVYNRFSDASYSVFEDVGIRLVRSADNWQEEHDKAALK